MPKTYLDMEQKGVARAKFDFHSKSSLEISFKKVTIRVDLFRSLLTISFIPRAKPWS